ncbi:DEAD/DEAH box helicase [Euzebya tangerina]|uniref:Lhr family helicase n=1 Tax=Euzebya tangerina TaxID=591198 RepID=UPI000E31236F
MEAFGESTRAWFTAAFAAPTAAQLGAWEHATRGESVLVSAATGSGKTLAAFLAAIDRLVHRPAPEPDAKSRTRVLYISPLKALAYDVDRNLRAPLIGIQQAAERLGETLQPVSVGLRSGDTTPEERRALVSRPPDILITTPESLYLYLTSRARETLTDVDTVIIDEVHAVAGSKRGAHMAVSLERLEALRRRAGATEPLQRIGLSATQRPLSEVAAFLGGGEVSADAGAAPESGSSASSWTPRPVRIVDIPSDKTLDIEVIVPVEDMADLGQVIPQAPEGPASAPGDHRRSIWPAVHPRVLDLIEAHRSTIVFTNSRRLSERLCARLNDLSAERWLAARSEEERLAHPDAAAPIIARAHHGSVAREQRTLIEEDLKAGRLPCVVATSSLELGIDMGAVDLVVQVESPGSVASGLQRVGRAGHQVGAPSVGKIFPKFRGDLVEAAVVSRRMLDGDIEQTRYPRNPLDVLAQQIVAMAAMEEWSVSELYDVIRAAAPFSELPRAQLDGVLDMLSGRYPSDEFAELRPRITWDRVADQITGRRGAQRIAVTSGGTIPDRGLYGVFIAGDGPGRRVGELDEEMVYETRPGETIVLGATTWRVEDITRDQVLVSPAPGEPGRLPFWHGDTPSRPIEVGQAVGAFLREVTTSGSESALSSLQAEYGLDDLAATNLLAYVEEQRQATEVMPSDTQIVVERFRDEIGDWRVCILSSFGGRIHAPWALAIETRVRERFGIEIATMVSDDGIVLRLPDAGWGGSGLGDGLGSGDVGAFGSLDGSPDIGSADDQSADLGMLAPVDGVSAGGVSQEWLDDEIMREVLVPPADEVEDLVVGELANSTLFASRFRECAARALLLPKRRPGGRTPLWQQRQRSQDLLAVASRFGSFPILLETYRECLRDVFDVPALQGVLRDITSRKIRITQVTTEVASPFASSLLFDYLAGYMYEGDAPLAERRASALTLDRELLAELLGADELRDLVDADALTELELQLQRLTDDRLAGSPDDVHDLLRVVGDLRTDEVVARSDGPAEEWLAALDADRRIYLARVGGEDRWAAVEDAARLRDGLGVPVPVGLPDVLAEPVERPMVDLVARYARTHGPFVTEDVRDRLGLPRDAVELSLKTLLAEQRVVSGEFRPGGSRREWIDTSVLRRLRRRSLAALRREVEPVGPEALARFVPAWQGAALQPRTPGVDRTFEVVEQLQGAPIPASILERDVLASRVRGYNPSWLDELAASGEIVWAGLGSLASSDGRVGLYLRDQAAVLLDPPVTPDDLSPLSVLLLEHLSARGASFWPDLYRAALAGASGDGSGGLPESEVVDALWDLVWEGLVTNDTMQALRAVAGGVGRRSSGRGRRGRARRPGRVASRSGPPTAAGRWSLVADLVAGGVPPTERMAARAAVLLGRHGVVTRDAVMGENLPGAFSGVYPVFKAMEDAGRARRGYFVEGLGGAQFAIPGAIDRLRALREVDDRADREPEVLALAATDPAQVYGSTLSWPESVGERGRPRRVPGAHVITVDGELVLFLEKGGRSAVTFTTDRDQLAVAAAGASGLVDAGRVDDLKIGKIDGEVPSDQPLVAALREAGFEDHPRGLVRR